MIRWLLVLPALLFAIAALIPAFKGGSINYTFFAVAVVWIIVAFAVGRAQKRTG